MPHIQNQLPEARFIHVIRDGRDVAASVRKLWFSPGQSIGDIAADWQQRILQARRDAPNLEHYIEVRYEELVSEPEKTLRAVCAFIELPFDPVMLTYHERTAERLREHGDRFQDGKLVATHEQRIEQQRMTMQPPTTQRVGTWRDVLSAPEVAEFEATAGGLLQQLGYELATASSETARRSS
jgi:hypothetical protein